MYKAHYKFDLDPGVLEQGLGRSSCENHFCEGKLKVPKLQNAILVPPGTVSIGGGIWYDGCYHPDSMLHRGWFDDTSLQEPMQWDDQPFDVFYLGMFCNCWGHCLTDGLKHVWPFVKGYCDTLLKNGVKLVYLTTGLREELPGNFWSCLRLLGVPTDNVMHIIHPTRFRTVLLPEPSFFLSDSAGRQFTQEYVDTIDYIVSVCGVERSQKPSRRVYFTRSAWQTEKADCGERIVARAFERTGYEIVSPECMTFKEQVRLMQSCSDFAVTEGSCAHNAVFMRPHQKMTILRKANYINGYQLPINDLRSLDVTYLDVHWSHLLAHPSAPWRGPFFLWVNQRLATFLGCRREFPIKSFLFYVWIFVKERLHVIGARVKHLLLGGCGSKKFF